MPGDAHDRRRWQMKFGNRRMDAKELQILLLLSVEYTVEIRTLKFNFNGVYIYRIQYSYGFLKPYFLFGY